MDLKKAIQGEIDTAYLYQQMVNLLEDPELQKFYGQMALGEWISFALSKLGERVETFEWDSKRLYNIETGSHSLPFPQEYIKFTTKHLVGVNNITNRVMFLACI